MCRLVILAVTIKILDFIISEQNIVGFENKTTYKLSLESLGAPTLIRVSIQAADAVMTKAQLSYFCTILLKTGFCVNFPLFSVLSCSKGI